MWCLPLLHFRPAFYRYAPVSLVKCKRNKTVPEVLSATRPRPAINVPYLFCSLSKKKKKISKTQKHLNSQPSTYVSGWTARSTANVITVIIRRVEVSSVQRNVYVLVDKSWSVSLKNKDVRESGFWNPRNFRLWNAIFLESGLQLKESGIALAIGIRNPKLHWQNLESNTWNPEQKKKGSNR